MRLSGRGKATLVAVTAAALAVTATGSAVASPDSRAGDARNSNAFDHIFVIMLENHSQSSVIDDPNAPYLNQPGARPTRWPTTTTASRTRRCPTTSPRSPATTSASRTTTTRTSSTSTGRTWSTSSRPATSAGAPTWRTCRPTSSDRFGPVLPDGTDAHRCTPRSTTRSCSSTTSRTTRRGWPRCATTRELGADLNAEGRAAVRVDHAQPVQRHARRRLRHGARPPGDAVPVRQHQGRRERRGAEAEGRHVRARAPSPRSARSTAWTKKSAIVIVTDENDYTGNTTNGGWENADGCCDSPYVAARRPARVSQTGPAAPTAAASSPPSSSPPPARGTWSTTPPYNHYSLLTTIEDNWNLGHLGHAGDTGGRRRPDVEGVRRAPVTA